MNGFAKITLPVSKISTLAYALSIAALNDQTAGRFAIAAETWSILAEVHAQCDHLTDAERCRNLARDCRSAVLAPLKPSHDVLELLV